MTKKVLITGISGFLGSWLYLKLKKKFSLFGIDNFSSRNNFFFNKLKLNKDNIYVEDIRNFEKCEKIFKKIKPDFVIHLAAQPYVSVGIKEPFETYSKNITGTLNMLSLSSKYSSGAFLNFTTDKVYLNNNKKKPFVENDYLMGSDPYSHSKSCADKIGQIFNENKKLKVTTFRAGNIIGGGDWGINRLIPDYYKSILTKKRFIVRQPNSVRPWQHVIFIVNAIDKFLSNYNNKYLSEFNVGPDTRSIYKVKNIVSLLEKFSSKKPKIIFKENNLFQEKKILKLNSKKFYKIFKLKYKSNIKRDIFFTDQIYNLILKNDKKLIKIIYEQLEQF